ncbi:MAG: hypothetical protein NZ693_07185 [Thermoflexales bacterium]|nr:hypothetical protein [Thermoflexales bacterium]
MKKILLHKALPAASAAALLFASAGTAHADLTDPSNYLAGVGSSSYSVMNTANTAATVVATYYNPDGTVAASQTLPSLPSRGRADVALSSVSGLPSNWVGSVVLGSDQDIVAVAVTSYTGRNPVPDSAITPSGTEASAYDALNAGATRLYAPALFRVPAPPNDNVEGRQVTRFTIQNTTGSTAAYTITYRSRNGIIVGTQTGTLAPFASRTINTRINSDVPSGVFGPSNTSGFSAEIESDQPLAGVSETSTSIGSGSVLANWTGDHTLLTPVSAATRLFSPAAFRLCPNTPAAQADCANYTTIAAYYTSFLQYSSFQLQNTTGSVANVTVDFIFRPTGLISHTLNFTIPAFSGYGINLFNGGSVPLTSPLFPALGGRFQGSIRVTSDQPLVGVGNIDFPVNFSAGSYNLIGDSDATNTIFVPRFDRVCPLNTPAACNPGFLGNFNSVSAVQVMNVGTSAVTLNSLQLYNSSGTLVHTITALPSGGALTLNPGAALGLNLFNGGDFAVSGNLSPTILTAISNNFTGTLVINGPPGARLKAVVEWRDGNRAMDVYNAFNR